MSEPIADPKLTDSSVDSGDVKELTVYETVMKRKRLAETVKNQVFWSYT